MLLIPMLTTCAWILLGQLLLGHSILVQYVLIVHANGHFQVVPNNAVNRSRDLRCLQHKTFRGDTVTASVRQQEIASWT